MKSAILILIGLASFAPRLGIPSMKHPCLALAVLSAAVFALPLPAQDEALLDPYEWILESYPFPAHELVHGFASEERGALAAPRFPEGELSEEAALDFLRKSNSVVAHYLKREGLALPEGTVFVFDPESLTLAARAPRITQSSIGFTSAAFREHVDRFVELNTVLLEGEAATIREQLALAGGGADHSGILARLEAAAAGGTVTVLKRGRAETRSGQRAKIDDSREIVFASDLALAPDGMVLYGSESLKVGTSWEFDAVVGADNATIDLNLALHHHFAPPRRRLVPFATTGPFTVASAVLEPSVADVTSQFTLKDGMTKMVGAWKPGGVPGGDDDPDRLQAGFVSVDLVEVLPLPNLQLAELLARHADAIAAIPEGRPVFEKIADEIPEGMVVRRFRIPPTFLSGQSAAGAGAADPFADPVRNEPTFTVRVTAKDILIRAGIPFPEGSSANYLSETATLVVRNTPENIELVEAYVMSIVKGVEKVIGFTTYFVEGPAERILDAVAATRGLANHGRVWEALAEDDAVRHLSSGWIESRSGQRSRLKTASEYRFPTGNSLAVEPAKDAKEPRKRDPEGTLSGELETVEVGTSIEIDPVLGADERSVDLNYAITLDYAAPFTTAVPAAPEDGTVSLEGPSTELHRAVLQGSLTAQKGMVRLLGFWRPEGDPRFEQGDLLQAVFAKIDVMPVGDEEED